MSYRKKSGILEGKFVEHLGCELFKFIGKGGICYIQFYGYRLPILNEIYTIGVTIIGSFGEYKKYKFHGYAEKEKLESIIRTNKLISMRETRKQNDDLNPVFKDEKYKKFNPINPPLNPNKRKKGKKIAINELAKLINK